MSFFAVLVPCISPFSTLNWREGVDFRKNGDIYSGMRPALRPLPDSEPTIDRVELLSTPPAYENKDNVLMFSIPSSLFNVHDPNSFC